MPPIVLIVEEGPASLVASFQRTLSTQACCEHTRWDSLVPGTLANSDVQLVVVDMALFEERVMAFLRWIRQSPIPIPVFAVLPECADHGQLQKVAEVVDDFLLYPLRDEELKLRVSRLLEPASTASAEIEQSLASDMGMAQFVGKHPTFIRALRDVRLFSASEAPVIICGETGTGKELFAHAIHSLSGRRRGPFIPLDCSLLPDNLAESELFGHCRGAFTDAHSDRKGLAAMAEGGTLFLDEIDALSLANQARLLRFLQERTYRALGADHFSRADVRIVAATNRSIEQCVREQRFRNDLYFRMNVLRLQLPPLRERKGDVSLLATHFLNHECNNGPSKVFSPAAMRRLENYRWPGNVRELMNTVQRAVVCSSGRQITPGHISFAGDPTVASEGIQTGASFQQAKHHSIQEFERSYVEALLRRHEGNITRAAKEAGKDRRAFGKLVKKHGIVRRSA